MNKKKKSTSTSPYPDEVIDRLARAFYPAILACWNSEEGQRSLVGARPLHLANARPFSRSKAPLGLLLLRKRELALAGGTVSSHPQQRKTERSRRGTLCCTYRCCLWSLAGCVRVDAPCFILTLISVSSFFIVTFVHLSFPYVLQCICLSQQCPFGAFLYLHTDRFFYMYPL